MKIVLAAIILLTILVVVLGSPVSGDKPSRDFHYGAPDKILPMSFAHLDHMTVNCVDCHHNYVDETGGGLCMTCHVTDPQLWPLLQAQFHNLCRGCHEDKQALKEAGGPPRKCMACHLGDNFP